MMKQGYEILKKYRIAVMFASIVVVMGSVLLFLYFHFQDRSSLLKVNEDGYILKYDRGWKVKKKEDDLILLKHKSSSTFQIEIISLDSEHQYSAIEDLMDEILYQVTNQNKEYQFLSKQSGKFTKHQISGFKILYETKSSQAMVVALKKGNQLVLMTYEAANDYFDILLDSVHHMIYEFDLKEKEYQITYTMQMKTEEIDYTEDKAVDKLLDKSHSYEIADKNYMVSYEIPSAFQLISLDTTYHSFELKGLTKGNLRMNATISNRNIYEYLDQNETMNVYSRYQWVKKDKDYTNFKESISKIGGKYDMHIYKNSYTNDKAVTYENGKKKTYQRKYEVVELIYALNRNHTLVMTFTSTDVGISKRLVDMIKISDVKNYASNIKKKKKDGYLIGELKRFQDVHKDKLDVVTLRLPEKYVEYDKGNNLYETKLYGLHYDEEKEMYDYQIKYQLTSNSTNDINKQVNNINLSFSKTYGVFNELVFTGETSFHQKKFFVYQGGYTDLGGIPFTNINRHQYYIYKTVLFYQIENGGYLIIEISGNGKEISPEIINEVTQFTIEGK